MDLFESMKGKYNRRATPRSRYGYHAFMTAWNLEVFNRYKRKAEGEENVIVVNRKSIQQLQEHYDSVEAKIAIASCVEEIWENGRGFMDQLNETLCENQTQQQPLPPVQPAVPLTCPQVGPRPIGNPTILNLEIVAGSLRVAAAAQRQQIPYNVLRPNQQAMIGPLVGYKRWKWCITCGYRKNAHLPAELFGKPCLKEWCGKCYQ